MYLAQALTVSTLLVSVSYALPPFEIRSASHQASEGAVRWENRLLKSNECKTNRGIVCPSSTEYDVTCIFKDQLCDRTVDCPGGEDESQVFCRILSLRQVMSKHLLQRRSSSRR